MGLLLLWDEGGALALVVRGKIEMNVGSFVMSWGRGSCGSWNCGS